ncbi:MAG: acetyl-CoA decarbonylase/synthase complex subunit delta [Deltaproteobacteria bacterium]|nr:acetyl-CoA decarbonylase/synthase complex subunit delta [Deltaproteobacteria bacterium]
MPINIPGQTYTGSVGALTLGSGDTAFTVGGGTAYPFYTFEGDMPNQPRIGIQIMDCEPEDWAAACLEPYKDVVHDPVAWAKKAQDIYGADFIQLWLKSTDPNGMNRTAEEAAETARAVADAISIPLIVWGTANNDKDAEVLSKVVEVCAGKDIIIGPVEEGNHKQLGAQALAYNLTIVASSPIDINLAKQLNILLTNLGVPLEKIIIDPTTGGLGYGIEYSYSVMERIRQAALTQADDKLQCPFLCNLADEVWKTKEAKMPDDPHMGEAKPRGILMEALTATTHLSAGADILIMRHPEAIQRVREYIAELGGFEKPAPMQKSQTLSSSATVGQAPQASLVADSLREGALCQIVQIMDLPVELAPGHAVALIKRIDTDQATEGLVLSAGGTSAAQGDQQAADEDAPQAADVEHADEFTPSSSWEPIESVTADYQYQLQKKESFDGKNVELIQENYDPGPAQGKFNWREAITDRKDQLQHVQTDLHYWYGEGYGSERRKKPA